MGRKKIIYFSLLFILVVICTITYFSYAFLIKTEEHHGKLNIVTGTLKYGLTSENLTNNSVTVGPGKTEFNLVLRSLNNIDSKYQLYYQSQEGVVVGYSDTNTSLGTIQANDQVTVKLIINNTTNSNQTVTFGVEGGFTGNDLVLSQGTAITEQIKMCIYNAGQEFLFPYSGNVQTFTPECNGTYKIELWGAKGGNSTSSYIGGNGAYTSGNIVLNENHNLYIYVGGEGKTNTTSTSCNANSDCGSVAGGYNGGGTSGNQNKYNGSGGGATDVRITNGEWNDFDSLKSRIMIAAGGGGASYYDSSTNAGSGGAAGGLNGYDGVGPTISSVNRRGGGALQNSIGYDKGAIAPGFGYGGIGIYTTGSLRVDGGGGSGYYGGSAGGDYGAGGGGGSSFISGYSGCNAIEEYSTSSNITHTGNSTFTYNDKNYIFTNGIMIDGKGCNWSTGSATNCGANQPQPDGTSTAGHTGNGYAKITYLGD